MTDALFDLNYLALKVGQKIHESSTSGALREEQATVNAVGTITVDGTPADFLDYGKCGWVAKPGSNDWAEFDFTDGQTATGVTYADGTQPMVGDVCCVKYMDSVVCDELTIPSDFVPGEITLILKGNLYRAGATNDVETSSIVGTLEVTIPRFQISAEGDLSLTSSGASQTALSGQALVSETGASCEGGGIYATIKDIRTGASWYDGLVALAIDGSDDITMPVSSTKEVKVYGVFNNGTSKLIAPTNLTYNCEEGTATGLVIDNNTGVLTSGTAEGAGTLEITVTEKPGVGIAATVTVTTA